MIVEAGQKTRYSTTKTQAAFLSELNASNSQDSFFGSLDTIHPSAIATYSCTQTDNTQRCVLTPLSALLSDSIDIYRLFLPYLKSNYLVFKYQVFSLKKLIFTSDHP
jgi:hypothetical protein